MGPKSESESLLSLGGACGGGEEGFSERGPGGGAGPMVRRRLLSSALLEMGEELRDWGRGWGWVSEASCWRFRLARIWGGRSGPAVAILRLWEVL